MSGFTLATTLVLRVGDAEAEYAATVTYHHHKASGDGWNEPAEPAHCEVVGITLDFTKTRRIPLDDLVVAEMQDGLQAELMEAWADDDAAVEEARADARRDDLMIAGVGL